MLCLSVGSWFFLGVILGSHLSKVSMAYLHDSIVNQLFLQCLPTVVVSEIFVLVNLPSIFHSNEIYAYIHVPKYIQRPIILSSSRYFRWTWSWFKKHSKENASHWTKLRGPWFLCILRLLRPYFINLFVGRYSELNSFEILKQSSLYLTYLTRYNLIFANLQCFQSWRFKIK
jgi:hypothetical protein